MPNSEPDGPFGLGTIVSNKGPLIALAGLGRLDILRTLSEALLVPSRVHEEVLAGGACGIGLEVMGTARLLVEAKKAGLLDYVSDAIARMRERGYWIHDDILRRAIAEAGEEG